MRGLIGIVGVAALLCAAGSGPALANQRIALVETVPAPTPRPPEKTFDAPQICGLIDQAAGTHGLPPEFLARLIWKESRFDIRALSPAGAQGVAQFMPATAKIRGLADPWDPRQAIPASAHFLADLRSEFGNLGLAAAAYNGGPDRVARWLGRPKGVLPAETEDYVLSITARPAAWFREQGRTLEVTPLAEGKSFAEACAALPVIATRALYAAADRTPWGVQIAAGISRRAAMRAFHRARGPIAGIVGDKGPIIVRSRLVGGRRLYSARIGADSRTEARRLCARIKSRGAPCVVRRN